MSDATKAMQDVRIQMALASLRMQAVRAKRGAK